MKSIQTKLSLEQISESKTDQNEQLNAALANTISGFSNAAPEEVSPALLASNKDKGLTKILKSLSGDILSVSNDQTSADNSNIESANNMGETLSQYNKLQNPAKESGQSESQMIKTGENEASGSEESSDPALSLAKYNIPSFLDVATEEVPYSAKKPPIKVNPVIKDSIFLNGVNIAPLGLETVYHLIAKQSVFPEDIDLIINNYMARLLFRKFESILLAEGFSYSEVKCEFTNILSIQFSNGKLLDKIQYVAKTYPELQQYIYPEMITCMFDKLCKQAMKELEARDQNKGFFIKWLMRTKHDQLQIKCNRTSLAKLKGKQNHLADIDKASFRENPNICGIEIRIMRMLLNDNLKDENKLSLLKSEIENKSSLLSISKLYLGLKGDAEKIWNERKVQLKQKS